LVAKYLSANVTVTPPAGYEVSVNGNSWYGNASPLVIARSGDSIAAVTISVRLNATAAGTYAGNITHSSANATTVNVAVTGETMNVPVITTSRLFQPFSQTIGKPANAQAFTLTGANLVSTTAITPPAGYEISIDTGKTWYTAATVPSLSVGTGNTLSRSVMVRLNASAAGPYEGNITVQTSGAAAVNVSLTGTAYSEFTINPNPANNYVNIFHGKLYTVAIIRIYNLKGHLMGTYYGKPVTNYTTINISALPNGMYFVELERFSEKVLLRFIKL
jgi:protein gp37